MLLDRANWRSHRPWLIGVVVATFAAVTWFIVASYDTPHWPGGSSLPGFLFGVVAGLIIVFECLLWVRKKVRAWPIGSAQSWLRAHIWLGLLCLPLAILHSGLRLGGPLSTGLMFVLILVIASGVWGLVLQNLLPRRMLDVPAETKYSQLNAMTNQLLSEADRLVSAACGGKIEERTNGAPSRFSPVVVGTGRLASPPLPPAPIAESQALAVFYGEQVAPYLHHGTRNPSPLASASGAAILFQNVKLQVPSAAHDVVNALESFCQQRRLWDDQARLHVWLHGWLLVHFPISVVLLVLLVVHAVVALRYW